jgi:hypothetical protein
MRRPRKQRPRSFDRRRRHYAGIYSGARQINVLKSLPCSSSSKMSTDYRFFHALNTVRSLQNPTGQNRNRRKEFHPYKRLRKIDYSLLRSRRLYFRVGTAAPVRTQSKANRDMPVSSFLLGLVLVGVTLAAYADRPLHVAPFHRSIGVERTAAPTALGAEQLEKN